MRFFFYGTLVSGECGPLVDAALRKLGAGVPALARGNLHAVPDPDGWYPAFLGDPAGGPVHGRMFTAGAGFTAADLAALDDYEEVRADDPDCSEYVRRQIEVTTGGASFMAEVYLYNVPLPPGARVIRGGDYRAFLAATGLPGFRFGEKRGKDSGG